MWSSSRGSSISSSSGAPSLPAVGSRAAKRRRSSSDIVAKSRPRFLAMRITPHGTLEQGLHPPEVFVQLGARIRPEQLGHGRAGTATRRVVAEPEVDAGAGALRTEADDPGVLQGGSGLASPGDGLVRRILRHY